MRVTNAGKKCSEAGCGAKAYCKGRCVRHYQQNLYRAKSKGARATAPPATRVARARRPPPRDKATPDDLERFCIVARTLGYDADAMLEEAELEFARAWLEQLRGRIQVTAPAPAPLQLRTPARARAPKPAPVTPVAKLEPLPPTDAEDGPRKDPRECPGCGGIINCLISCPVGTHRNARQKKAAAG